MKIPILLLMLTGLLPLGCQQRNAASPSAVASVSSRPALLAELKDAAPGRYTGAAQSQTQIEGHLNEWGTGGAFVMHRASGARVFYREQASPQYENVEGIAIGPDGNRVAYAVLEKGKYRMVLDGKAGPAFDHVGDPRFTPDGRHLYYQADTGGSYHLVIDENASAPIFRINGEPVFSPGQDAVLIAEKGSAGGDFELASYSFSLKRRTVATIKDAVDVFFSNHAAGVAATVARGGKKLVVDFPLLHPEKRREGELFDEITHLSFDPSAAHILYVGKRGSTAFAVADGKAEPLPYPNVVERPVLNPVTGAVGTVVMQEYVLVHQSHCGKPATGKRYEYASEVTYSPDGTRTVYAAEKKGRGFLVLDGRELEACFDKVVSPRFSPDGRFLVYRARKDGQRFLVIADRDGRTLRQLQPYEQVFAPSFTKDGKSVAYAVKDGARLLWKVEAL